MKLEFCNFCGRALPDMRVGVVFTPLKTRIFDLVWRAGEGGISGDDIRKIVWDDSRDINIRTIKSHISQINEMIEDAGWRIRATNPRGGYRIVRTETEAKDKDHEQPKFTSRASHSRG